MRVCVQLKRGDGQGVLPESNQYFYFGFNNRFVLDEERKDLSSLGSQEFLCTIYQIFF